MQSEGASWYSHEQGGRSGTKVLEKGGLCRALLPDAEVEFGYGVMSFADEMRVGLRGMVRISLGSVVE